VSARRYPLNESQAWDRLAPRYDRRAADHVYAAAVEAAVRALAVRAGECVLDAGCGTGLPLQHYLCPGLRVVALDLSEAALGRLRAALGSPAVEYVRGDVTRLPFAAATFDRALCANTVQHLPTAALRRRCVAELARVTRPGGRVVVTAHQWSLPKRRAGWKKEGRPGGRGQPPFIHRFEGAEFHDLLAAALAVEGVSGAGFPLPYRYKLAPLSACLEWALQRSGLAAPWAHMLVGVCRAP
jgi:SAM-dependent methyltransferase